VNHFAGMSEMLATMGGEKILLIAIAVSAVSGFIRGFSGFGSALLFIPAMAAIYDPQIAAATLVLIDIFGSAIQTAQERHNCQWADVLPLTGAALVGALVGTIALSYAEPVLLRYLASAVVLVALALITAGWRYQGRPRRPLTAGVGLVSGFLGGAVAMEGPPAVLFWLGGTNTAKVTRANVMVFIFLTETAVLFFYAAFGLFSLRVVTLFAILLPFFWAAFWLGDRNFHGMAERTYRIIAAVIIALSAIGSLLCQNG
jgi:uncharacterized membrane protein YfcA